MPSLKARPSKTYFHRLFEADMASQRGEWGVDIACANWKNRRLFQTRHYLGVDIRHASVSKGRDAMGGDGYGVVSDILAPGLMQKTFDLVVCTHTLSHLAPNLRLNAVNSLIELLRPNGCLIFNVPCEDKKYQQQLLKSLNELFMSVDAVRYRNIVSQWYENRHSSTNESVVFSDGAPGFLRRAVIHLIAACEHLPYLRHTGTMLYVCAAQRIDAC